MRDTQALGPRELAALAEENTGTVRERAAVIARRAKLAQHAARCIYCEHGPYCLACPAPGTVSPDAYVCGPCREAITRSEIAADPYYHSPGSSMASRNDEHEIGERGPRGDLP